MYAYHRLILEIVSFFFFFQAEGINYIVAMNLALHGFLLQGKFRELSVILVAAGKV